MKDGMLIQVRLPRGSVRLVNEWNLADNEALSGIGNGRPLLASQSEWRFIRPD